MIWLRSNTTVKDDQKVPARWTVATIALALAGLARAVSYMPTVLNQYRPPVHALEGLLPPMVWGIAWLVMVGLLVMSLWWRCLVPAPLGGTAGMHLLWGLSFMAETWLHGATRAWVSGINYLLVPILILIIFTERPQIRITVKG